MTENIWLIIHLFGVVIGAGSVTTAYARELYFRWRPEHAHERGLLPVISPLLNIAFALVVVSGFGLYIGDAEAYNASPIFWTKISLLGLLLLNHIFINAYVRPSREKLKVLTMMSEYFSLIGWYALIAISVLI